MRDGDSGGRARRRRSLDRRRRRDVPGHGPARQQVVEKVEKARALLGGVNALERFSQWVPPEESEPPAAEDDEDDAVDDDE